MLWLKFFLLDDTSIFLQDLNADVEMCTVGFIDIQINTTAALITRLMAGPRYQRTIQLLLVQRFRKFKIKEVSQECLGKTMLSGVECLLFLCCNLCKLHRACVVI